MKVLNLVIALALCWGLNSKAADSSASGSVIIGGSFFTALNSLTIKALDCGSNLTTCSSGLDGMDFSTATNTVNLGNVTGPRYVAVQFILLGRLFKQDYLTVASSVTHNTNTTVISVEKLRYIRAGGAGIDLEGLSGATDLPEAVGVVLTGSSQVLWDQGSSAAGDVQSVPINFLADPVAFEARAILKVDAASSSTSTTFQSTVNFTWTAKDGTP